MWPSQPMMRAGWYQDAAGKWAADGPAENQPPVVQRLRGPYQHKHTAERAADKHFKAFRVTGHPA